MQNIPKIIEVPRVDVEWWAKVASNAENWRKAADAFKRFDKEGKEMQALWHLNGEITFRPAYATAVRVRTR